MRGISSLLLIALLGSSWPCQGQDSVFYLGGIQINEPDHDAWMGGLQAAGMNTVAVTAYAKQGNWNTDHIWWEAEEPAVVAEIAAAKRAGMQVVFIARLALDHAFPANTHYWHGQVMPQTDEQLASWFAQYTRFVVQWARYCETMGVEVFGIGSELRILTATVPTDKVPRLEGFFLNPLLRTGYRALRLRHRHQIAASTWWQAQGQPSYPEYLQREIQAQRHWAQAVTYHRQRQAIPLLNARRALLEQHWRTLIAEVRKVYSGQLTYAANFDNYHRVAFWDALDIVGINAYFPLLQSTEAPTQEAVTRQWGHHSQQARQVLAAQGIPQHPILFTELGYTPYAGALVAPWSGFGFVFMPRGKLRYTFQLWDQQPVRPTDRAMAVQGLAQARQQGHWPALQGVLYWKLTTQPALLQYEPFGLALQQHDPLQQALRDLAKNAE